MKPILYVLADSAESNVKFWEILFKIVVIKKGIGWQRNENENERIQYQSVGKKWIVEELQRLKDVYIQTLREIRIQKAFDVSILNLLLVVAGNLVDLKEDVKRWGEGGLGRPMLTKKDFLVITFCWKIISLRM